LSLKIKGKVGNKMRVGFLKERGEHCIVQVIERDAWLETGDARFHLWVLCCQLPNKSWSQLSLMSCSQAPETQADRGVLSLAKRFGLLDFWFLK
jgi:hypothetical protein